MPANQTQRPKFYEEQYLGAADLTAAVDYTRIQQARHALGGHTWGIALGLQLQETPQPGEGVAVHLLPGYAWDGYGRPVVVLTSYKIPEEKFSAYRFDPAIDADGKGRLLPVWLRYDESATQNPRPGFEACEIADQRSRIQETFRIEIGEMSAADRYSGVTVAARSLADAKAALQAFDPTAPLVHDESIPHQNFPEPQDRARWLIPIGYVRWLPVLNQPGHFVARDDSGSNKDSDTIRRLRRYVGVVAEEIEAADGAIRLRDRSKDATNSFFQAPTREQTTGSTNDLVWVEGNLRVIGNAKLCGGRLDFRDQRGSDFEIPLVIQRAGTRALQVAIGPHTENNYRFAVGPLNAAGILDEKFAVLSGGNVGVGTSAPTLKLDIRGDFGRTDNAATAHLWGSQVGDVGRGVLFLRSGGGVVAFDGNDNVGIGTDAPASKLEVAGDVTLGKIVRGVARALPAEATMLWNDGTWLRLNQNLDMSKPILGVHTPGLFASGSLNVGGAEEWRDPGPGNVWVTGRVGIGTTIPTAKLHVFNSTPGQAVAGVKLDRSGADKEANLMFATGGSQNWALHLDNDGTNNLKLWDQRIGDFAMIWDYGTGNVSINRELNVSGTARKLGGGTWTILSDTRLKKKVEPLTSALNLLLQLRGVRFEWNEPEKMGNLTGQQMGLIAEEVETVFPEWVSTGPDGYKELTIRGFEALTIEALRELKTKVETIQSQLHKKGITADQAPGIEAVRELKTEIDLFKARLEKVETRRPAPRKK